MSAREYFWCERCGVHTRFRTCFLCGGESVAVGHRIDPFDRRFHLELFLGIDLRDVSDQELERILQRLVPCPLCQGAGIIEPPERDYWAECPVCWGAMYRTVVGPEDLFDPRVRPFGHNIAASVLHSMFRNRLKPREG